MHDLNNLSIPTAQSQRDVDSLVSRTRVALARDRIDAGDYDLQNLDPDVLDLAGNRLAVDALAPRK